VSYNAAPVPAPARILLFRPTLADGGADRATLTLLEKLDRARIAPVLALLHTDGPLVADVPDDVEVIEVPARRLATSAVALARVIRAVQPDVFVCTSGPANVVAIAAHKLARSRARLVLSERSAVDRDRGRVRNALEPVTKRALYRFADAVMAVSDGVADDLVQRLHLPAARISVVYNPVVDDALGVLAHAPVEHPWFDGGRPLALAVGRLVAVKDYPTMLRAFEQVHAATGARLAILGQGPEHGAIESMAKQSGIGEHVQLLGFDKNPYRYMARATVLLQSSLAEGLPGTIIQSMACGTPVVSTDCDHGPREVIRDGHDGFLVPVRDPAALARRATELISDPGLRATFSQRARLSAARFSVTSSIARYEQAILGTNTHE